MSNGACDLNPVNSKHSIRGLKTPCTLGKYSLYSRRLISSQRNINYLNYINYENETQPNFSCQSFWVLGHNEGHASVLN